MNLKQLFYLRDLKRKKISISLPGYFIMILIGCSSSKQEKKVPIKAEEQIESASKNLIADTTITNIEVKDKDIGEKKQVNIPVPSNPPKVLKHPESKSEENVASPVYPVGEEVDESNSYMPSNDQNRCDTEDNPQHVLGDTVTLVPEIKTIIKSEETKSDSLK